MANLPDTIIFNRCVFGAKGVLLGYEPMRVRKGEVVQFYRRDGAAGATLVVGTRGGCGFIDVRETVDIVGRLTGAEFMEDWTE
jgi:hypothetical protein